MKTPLTAFLAGFFGAAGAATCAGIGSLIAFTLIRRAARNEIRQLVDRFKERETRP